MQTSYKTIQNELNELRSELAAVRYDLRLAQSAARIGSWRLNILKNELTWSDEAYRIFNVRPGTSLNYEMFLSFIHPADREMVDREWNAAIKGKEYNIDHRIIVDGKIKWVNETAILEFDKEGMLVSGFGTVQDITKQKDAALELKQNEETLRQYAESLNFLSGTATSMIEKLGSPELFRFISDSLYKVADGAMITFSEFDVLNQRLIVKEFRGTDEEKEKTIKIFGREPEGLVFDFPGEIRERIKPGGLEFLAGGVFELTFGQLPQNFCADFEHALGINSVFAMACSVEHDILGTVAVLSHEQNGMLKNRHVIESVVTQAALALKRKRAEDDLRASEAKFSSAFRSSPNGLVLSNMEDGTIYEINDTYIEITGHKKEDVIGKSSLDLDVFVNPDDRINAVNLLREKGSLRHYEIRIKHPSGTERTVLLSIDILSLPGRKTMLTTMQDVTPLKQAESKISDQANFITAITESVPDMISVIELPSRNLFYTNREPFLMQGFSSEEMKKMTVEERNELIHPDDREALSDYYNKLLNIDTAGEIMLEYRARNLENKWMWFRA
ncbi:MAG TPA: PAS domain S-box protein, partial [Bacteroidales bacterium]|nr:PAS domain S-box protein [Bacteroidales bacterium]